MKIHYNVTGDERKALVKTISQAAGAESVYKRMPTCAYEIGPFTVTKDGTLEFEDGIENSAVLEAAAAAGFEGVPEQESDKTGDGGICTTVTIPMGRHTGESLRNLVNLTFTRACLLNRALGTSFRVEKALVVSLQTASLLRAEDFLKAVAAFEDEHGKAVDGITFTPEDITFATLPETAEPEEIRAFTVLCSMMNKQALSQKRIQAKAVNGENEKYALRIWLTRLGMNGPEHKEIRKVLMKKLTGHCAFRTEADKERWTQRQAERRQAAKAAEGVAES